MNISKLKLYEQLIFSEILGEHGSSLDRVLKVSVHLTNAADFYEFKLAWREYFPECAIRGIAGTQSGLLRAACPERPGQSVRAIAGSL